MELPNVTISRISVSHPGRAGVIAFHDKQLANVSTRSSPLRIFDYGLDDGPAESRLEPNRLMAALGMKRIAKILVKKDFKAPDGRDAEIVSKRSI